MVLHFFDNDNKLYQQILISNIIFYTRQVKKTQKENDEEFHPIKFSQSIRQRTK